MNRIAELRKLNKISQADFGKAMGVAQNTISQWERGAREPDLTTLKKIADYFSVSLDYVLGRKQEISYALLDGGEHFGIDDSMYREIMEFAAYAKEQKKSAPSKDEADLVELTELFGKLSPENRTILLAAAKGLAQDK